MRRRAPLLPAALALALLAGGCGTKHERIAPGAPQAVSVMLDSHPNADHVGLYDGIARGEFRRAALKVDVRAPGTPAAPLKLVAAGRVDLAIAHEPELLLARDAGAPLVAVGAIVQRPLTSLIALLKSPIRLAGATVGTTGIPYQEAYLTAVEAKLRSGTAKRVKVGSALVPAMLSGKVDATLGGAWNREAIQLRERGRHPLVVPVEQAGVPTYDELVVVARRDTLRNKGEIVRRFMQALGRGYADVRADPAGGVDALIRAVPGLARSRKLEAASVRATLPAFFPTPRSRPFGFQDRADWRRFGDWLLARGLLKSQPHADFALTNEFLAGQGA